MAFREKRHTDKKEATGALRFFGTTLPKVVKHVIVYAWLLLWVGIALAPISWMVSAAFSDAPGIGYVPIIPTSFTLDNYRDILTYRSETGQLFPDYVDSFLTTLLVATVTTVLVVILSALVGFAVTRFRFHAKKPALLLMMGLQMFPGFMGMIALFIIFRVFGWLNNPFYLSLIYVAGAIPFNTFIVRGFMRNVPKSLDEAAAIDGATNLQIMIKIIVPLAAPIMGFIAVTAFMGPWLDYILPSILMPNNETVAMWLFRMNVPTPQPYRPMWFMAGALFLAVPIMIVQIYMQKYVTYGLTAGAEKG